MKILFNASNLTAGGGLFAGLSVLQHWLKKPGVEVCALLSPALLQHLGNEQELLKNFEVVPDSPGSSLSAGRAFRRQAAAFEATQNPDMAFTPFGPPVWRPKAPHLCGFANGLYLPCKKAQPYGGRPTTIDSAIHLLKRAAVLYSLAHDTDLFWVETEGCKTELQKLLQKKKIVVIPNEVHGAFRHSAPAVKSAGQPFEWLFPAANYPHKNFALLRAVLQKLPAKVPYRFSVTLPAEHFESCFGKEAAHPALRNLGLLPPEKLAEYYALADGIFLPSVAEIFSATWLEAFATGRPLLCADIPAAREVCGNAAPYFDGHSVPAALEALGAIAGDEKLRTKLIAAGKERLAHFRKGPSRAEALFELALQTVQNTKRQS